MTSINGGIVRFEKTVKTGDYENEKAAAELSFTVDEGDDYEGIFDKAADLAHSKVLSILGRKATAKAAPAAVEQPKAADKPAKPPKMNKTKADLEAEAKVPAPAEQPKAEPEAAAEDWEGGGAAPEPALSDKELVEKISAHNAKIKNPPGIKKLIAKYAGDPPKGAKDIPAEQRAKFVAELLELKPLA